MSHVLLCPSGAIQSPWSQAETKGLQQGAESLNRNPIYNSLGQNPDFTSAQLQLGY